VTYASPSHPDDEAARNALIGEYRRIREERGVSKRGLAAVMGVDRRAVQSFEEHRPANPKVASLVKYGEPLALRPAMDVHGFVVAPAVEAATLRACGYLGAAVLAELVATRRAMGISQAGLARRCDAWTWSAVSCIEIADHEPLLATLQRYARALGGRLGVRWEEL
jgi:transcriptional regulator with XRE-family HTH domain